MADRNKLMSPLTRAKIGMDQWIEMLPKDVQCHAESSLERLCEVAFREIEQAYYDGHNQRANSERIRKAQAEVATELTS